MEDVLQKILADMLEEASPEMERRVLQALSDVDKQVTRREGDERRIREKLTDVVTYMASLNGEPAGLLLRELMRKRKVELEAALTELGLEKLKQKRQELDRELEAITATRKLANDLMVNAYGKSE